MLTFLYDAMFRLLRLNFKIVSRHDSVLMRQLGLGTKAT